ncbi:HAD family hydrolase [Frondihabitans australicus]|uniref:Putative hydrolase of the HAD superfamily n=1 Tax=Frondihabitans australicus TaxID=386892 RepID=A0A495IFB2_9MICO|nr:HAD family phosphatase [Frondihabitans australicus]RKR73736.1 putative hydrolase of the HAD superfamily [Frondihabitans australicus]
MTSNPVAPLSLPGKTVVFDYGEVISRTPADSVRDRLLALAGATDIDAFWASYGRHRHALDGGSLSVVDYWRTLASENGLDLSITRIHELWAIDFPAWIDPEPGTVDVIAALHEGGTPLAILSNAGFDYASPLRFSPVGSLFDHVYVSAEMYDLKPNASIYRTVLDELGIEPSAMVFIDNKAENIEGAQELGITGHVFTSPAGLESFLRGLAAPAPSV